MKWISPLVTKQKAFRTSLILAGVSLACLLLPFGVKSFISSNLVVVYTPFWGVSSKLHDFFEIYEINRQLKRTITEQMLELSRLRAYEKENDRLRRLLKFKEAVQYDLIPAKIVAVDPKRRENAVLTEVSPDASVIPDLPVVNVNGLVGKTTSILGRVVTIELLTSPDCRAAARDANTRVLGIVRWDGGRFLQFDNVELSDTVSVGDTVITSGLGGVFPENLPIGTIESVESGKSPFFKQIDIQPFVNFRALDELTILKRNEN
jgi:rod shape-determining protein MreC